MSALVIKAWKASEQPIDDKGNHIAITGREGGLVAWILSKVNIDPTTTIRVGSERLEFSSASLSGTQSRLIPLQGICSTYYGYHKPWKTALGIGALSLFMGGSMMAQSFFAGLVVMLIGWGIAAVIYFLNRTLTLGFIENSGVVNGIQFKRSVIENIDITQEQARQVCELMQKLIEAKEKRL
ncbi:hypothetical protein DR66_4886 [Delftia acidovorans]|uniref:hypothetical protein n=1 Tax=Delftia acidovorans TaxID=80866 RepID=UPI00050008F1|nr:hypothetical protein [Delftia acidovorans]KFJ13515.1 hypothetical protein DR66_4886 [Delftia acidovorans]QQB50077.1 hypothetical protein I6H54_27710 [Delftia acidovorans]